MDDRSYTVYVHINKANGKRYYGQTKRKVQDRWQAGEGYKKHQPVFYNAILKYGWDGFEHIIIADNLTINEANKLETELIAKHHTLSHEHGYNILYGGGNRTLPESVRQKIKEAHTGMVSGPCSEERKRKIGDANRGRVFSAEARQRMSRGQKGKKYSEDTKKQKSEQLKREWALGLRKPNPKPSPLRKPIIAINLLTKEETRFDCICEAAKALNIHRPSISSVLTGNQKTTKGYAFKYAKEVT